MNLRNEIIEKAESFPGIRAGIARLEDVLNAPSYKAVEKSGQILGACSSDQKPTVTQWPAGGKYDRPSCMQQMDSDREKSSPDAEAAGEEGASAPVIKFCRECEPACPAGT